MAKKLFRYEFSVVIPKRYQNRLKNNDILLIFNLYKLLFDDGLVSETIPLCASRAGLLQMT
jgi:hypothetical protein